MWYASCQIATNKLGEDRGVFLYRSLVAQKLCESRHDTTKSEKVLESKQGTKTKKIEKDDNKAYKD